MGETPYSLSIDIGSSSVRVMLWDIYGRDIDSVRVQHRYEMHKTPDGGVEMDAEELCLLVDDCVDKALSLAGNMASHIRAVGITTFWHSVIGLDASGACLTPIISWADSRPGAAARKLRQTWDEAAVHARTGCMTHASYFPAKLLWLRETFPEIYNKVRHWVSPSEYLLSRWFGTKDRTVSVSMASGTGIFNQKNMTWDAVTLKSLAIAPETLSEIVDNRIPSVGLLPKYAQQWQSLKQVPFFPATGDGATGNIGSGCTSPQKIAINLGTSGAIRIVFQSTGELQLLVPPKGLWRYRVDSNRGLVGGAFSDGGDVFEWMESTLRLPDRSILEQELLELKPGQHNLTFLPFLAGERSMGWNPDRRATLYGMNLSTRPLDILQAAMEGVALRFTLVLRHLMQLFPQATQIIASGGALGASPAWAQMFANALQKPITLAEEPEASSRGAALLAMEAANLLNDVGELEARVGKTYYPDFHTAQIYATMLEKQEQTNQALLQEFE